MKPRCVVLGGGGHAKMVLEALLLDRKFLPVGFTDKDPKSEPLFDIPCLGDDRVLEALRKKGIRSFIVGVGGVPDNSFRAMLFDRAIDAGLNPIRAIHPSASVSRDAEISMGTVVLAKAVVNAGALISRNVIVNSSAVVEHDATVLDHAHVCPGAILCGGVVVGEGAFIGAGAIVRENVKIGSWAVIGAGAVVLEDVAHKEKMAGVPARSLKGEAK